jgi:hypothetical protein
MRLRRAIVAATTITVAITMTLQGASAAGKASRWRVVESPGGDGGGLVSASFPSSSDGWAAGSTGVSLQGNGIDTMIQHWDGSTWKVSPSFGVPQSDEALTGISAAGPDEAWAVGWHDPYGTERIHGLVLRWEDQQWKVDQDADHSPIPRAVDARTADDVWAVGVGLFEHFDGSTWTHAPPPRADVTPNAVTVLAEDDAWVVGSRLIQKPGYHSGKPYIAHWDGSAWSSVSIPLSRAIGSLSGVAAASPTDIWAVGSINSAPSAPLALHYDGVHWRQVQVPDAPEGGTLSGVTVVSANDVWAVGSQDGHLHDGFAVLRTFSEHWDGSVWTTVKSPNDSDHDNWLAATVASGSRVWAFGGDGGTLVERRR